jgi:hypothetical protein
VSAEAVNVAIGSATGTACAVVGLIFLKHWRATRDELFASFAAAFWLMAANRLALVMVGENQEASTLIYLVRFAAFALILWAIVRKNMGPGTGLRR